eukprot:40945-Chlamydomonas_euryale.AAC.4
MARMSTNARCSNIHSNSMVPETQSLPTPPQQPAWQFRSTANMSSPDRRPVSCNHIRSMLHGRKQHPRRQPKRGRKQHPHRQPTRGR